MLRIILAVFGFDIEYRSIRVAILLKVQINRMFTELEL
jgi:hypothetical protein